MRFIKSFFKMLGSCINYINTYFKTFVLLLLVLWLLNTSSNTPSSLANLQRIDLQGQINNVDKLIETINKAKDNEAIKGVLFVVDSPGGAFAPSMELALAIKDLKSKKPVVAYASGTMASGSYLSAASANKIISNPASFIGSIGVIMQGADLSELANKLGIKAQTIKAGTYKEAGTFTRKWSEEEKEYLQNLVEKSYDIFTHFVADERKLEFHQRQKWADARVFLADQALELGLIDELGNIQKAKLELQKLSGVKTAIWAKPDVVDKFMDKLSQQSSSFIAELIDKILASSNSLQRF
ncbi:signal peptide peptidase SppA [Campylobacter sp. MIT 99-7217]|uniref:signal peptide peptidase SppA n=1 Tax=Campylobacter sp. MIT 99-7217 TaxID=535091 RepID=UPI001158D844|nr:signal peptide peptidase SppA [Campylobacter sp. MIT 99-7217]TQR29358.1 signal peptide peptidase SppA [Campylobacter sp. MIT 99-7217]